MEKNGFNKIVFGIEIDMKVSVIIPNPNQPRVYFDPEELDNLAKSMSDYKQLEAIKVFPNEQVAGQPQTFTILSGERRWQAAKSNNQETIKTIVVYPPTNADELRMDAYLLNCHANHTPYEHFRAVEWMIKKQGLNAEDIARRTGQKLAWVQKYLSLIHGLHPDLVKQLDPTQTKKPLPLGAALKLAGLDKTQQPRLAEIIQSKGLSVAQTVEALSSITAARPKKQPRQNQPVTEAREFTLLSTLTRSVAKSTGAWKGEKLETVSCFLYQQEARVRKELLASLTAGIENLQSILRALQPAERKGK